MKKPNFETYIWKGDTEEEFFQHMEKQELKKIFKYLVICNVRPHLGFACKGENELALIEIGIKRSKTKDGKAFTYSIIDTDTNKKINK